MSDLNQKTCLPCESGVKPLTLVEAEALLTTLHTPWTLNDDGTSISRLFHFKDFYQTMSFVNAVAHVANSENHHPDLDIGWGRCRVVYTTHSIGGLSENDFICAAKVNSLPR